KRSIAAPPTACSSSSIGTAARRETAWRTCAASVTTSGPIPSPGRRTTRRRSPSGTRPDLQIHLHQIAGDRAADRFGALHDQEAVVQGVAVEDAGKRPG